MKKKKTKSKWKVRDVREANVKKLKNLFVFDMRLCLKWWTFGPFTRYYSNTVGILFVSYILIGDEKQNIRKHEVFD